PPHDRHTPTPLPWATDNPANSDTSPSTPSPAPECWFFRGKVQRPQETALGLAANPSNPRCVHLRPEEAQCSSRNTIALQGCPPSGPTSCSTPPPCPSPPG